MSRLRTATVFLAVALTVGALARAGGFSGAAFTAASGPSTAGFSAAADWVPPAVTLTTPADGSFTNDSTPALAGAAGTAPGDASTVSADLFAGASATGTPVQTRTATVVAGAWNATATSLADGQYTARARQADTGGNTGLSTPHTFTVDTTAPRATDVQAADGGGTAGHLDAGDTLTFSFSEPIDPATVLAGWSGAATAVRVRFTNSGGRDVATVLDAAGGTTVKLGSVDTAGNYVSATATFTATLAQAGGGASLTVTLGTLTAGTLRSQAVNVKTMVWTPVAGPRDRAGNALSLSPATVSETGAPDQDF